MAKKSALNQIISRTCVGIVNSMVSWKQSSRTALANFLGTVTWYVLARRRHIALTNLRLCFPDWTEEKRTATAKQVFRNLVRAALDHSVLAKGSAEQVQAMVKFTGKEKFLELCDEGPLIVVARTLSVWMRAVSQSIPSGAALRFIRLSPTPFGINGLMTPASDSPIRS